MVDDWLSLRASGGDVLMLATERATVAELNQLARAHLVARSDIVRRSRTYCAPDDHRTITLAVGDLVILRRNRRITQPDRTTTAVRNGMTGRVRRPHVDYGYARTVDTAQGATVDHSLLAPSTGASAERAYVALSRGRLTNRIYAIRDHSWIDAIGRGRSHALAIDQTPAVDRAPHRVARLRDAFRDDERHPPLEIDL